MTTTKACRKNNSNCCYHIPMDLESYPIDIVRTTLRNVLSPMGYKFTVRERENSKMGEYASVSITPPGNKKN